MTPAVPIYRLTLPLAPSANRYWRTWRGRAVVSPAARQYKADIALLARAAGVEPLAGPVIVHVHVHRARRAGDLDNWLKVLSDALQGVAYQDDNQIVEWHAYRHDDKTNPRMEVEVRGAAA